MQLSYHTATTFTIAYGLHSLGLHHIELHPCRIFPMEYGTITCLVTFTSLTSFSHCILYGWGCLVVGKFSFSTKVVEATIVQLLPSIITPHNLFLIVHLVWNIFSLYSTSIFACKFNTCLIMSISPSSTYSTFFSSICSSSSSSSNALSSLYTSPCATFIIINL